MQEPMRPAGPSSAETEPARAGHATASSTATHGQFDALQDRQVGFESIRWVSAAAPVLPCLLMRNSCARLISNRPSAGCSMLGMLYCQLPACVAAVPSGRVSGMLQLAACDATAVGHGFGQEATRGFMQHMRPASCIQSHLIAQCVHHQLCQTSSRLWSGSGHQRPTGRPCRYKSSLLHVVASFRRQMR